MRFSLRDELLNTAAFFLTVTIIGLIFQRMLFALFGGAIIYLGWHVRNIANLLCWLEEGMPERPEVLYGIWAELARYISALHNRSRKRKRKTSRFLRRFREAAAAVPDAALILGRRGEIEWCNPASKELLGLESNRVCGHFFTHLIRQPELLQYLNDGDYSHPIEIPSPVDESRILSLRVNHIGKKYQRLLVARDVTQNHLIDQVRRDFVANVSHELRTPLTVLRGFLETLGDAAGECPDWARSIELMGQQATRMERIVNDLLMLSRLELGGVPTPGQEPVPVPELLSGIVQDARILSGDHDHKFTLEIEPDLWLRGNTEELRNAFSNLVFNAVQHTSSGSQIRITWRKIEDQATLIVADNGDGIPARHLPRLTERFYRVDKARSRAKGGTGLGLAIVKHVLTRHGGELEVHSELGKGSIFTCRLPSSIIYHRFTYFEDENQVRNGHQHEVAQDGELGHRCKVAQEGASVLSPKEA